MQQVISQTPQQCFNIAKHDSCIYDNKRWQRVTVTDLPPPTPSPIKDSGAVLLPQRKQFARSSSSSSSHTYCNTYIYVYFARTHDTFTLVHEPRATYIHYYNKRARAYVLMLYVCIFVVFLLLLSHMFAQNYTSFAHDS
uniref:Uncharacterized protein n=1 Tax=Trichogramma kaykai TaxID=54128 RepID=A0ABD2WAL4_9HYME